MFFVFWYFSLREKSRRWLNFLPVGADSKSGATWVSQSVSRSVAQAGTGQAIPAVALLSISLAPTNCAFCFVLFCFGFLLQWELHSRRETQTSCCCCCCCSRKEGSKEARKEGRREERKQPVVILLQQQLQTDAAVFQKQKKQQFPCLLLQRGGVS